MEWFARKITGHKKFVTFIFTALACLCGILMIKVKVNYSLADYLPPDAESTVTLNVMQEEFNEAIPNERVMVQNVSIQEALEYKEKLKAIDGVEAVMWLDDMVNLKQPIDYLDPLITGGYYKNGNALFQVTVAKGREMKTTDEIYKLIGEENAVDGEAATNAFAQKSSFRESMSAMMILIPVVVVILSLMSSSWIEPILYLATIGISVLINLGSNIFLGEISYITQSISPILQMAVSLDYAIFLLHCFDEERAETDDVETAMVKAMQRAFPSVSASAATTLFGFLALMFMRFKIGSDLGLNLVKGIIFSYIAVMVFLPALTLLTYKWLDKTRHKKLLPEFTTFGKFLMKIRIPALILLLIIVVPCYRAQERSNFIYGMGEANQEMKLGQDNRKINEIFGRATATVALVPKGNIAKEKELAQKFHQLPQVTAVISYADTVGTTIPEGFLDEKLVRNFYSDNYARIIVSSDTAEEGEEAFALVEQIRDLTAEYYDEHYSTGQSAVLYDMKEVVSHDTKLVNTVAILAIGLVLVLTFKAWIPLLPLLLLFVIEAAIWINLAIPYFMGQSLVYIGFLVINTVQLGATIDYAIFITNNYTLMRKKYKENDAASEVLSHNLAAIMTSAVILASAGFCLKFTSSNPIVADLGLLLGRGTIFSFLAVAAILPMLLILFDKAIGATLANSDFYKEDKTCEKESNVSSKN